MPFLYVYEASDFIGGLPIEQGAAAAGTPTFTLTLAPGATPVRIEVSDDEAVFDEVDATQSLATGATIDGTAYAAGTTINTAYDLINTTTGHQVTSFHMGGDGFQQGAVVGLVSTVPLIPGASYTFDSERTSHLQNNQYDDYVACFADGTFIDTIDGARPVETLVQGALIPTLDHDCAQPLQMILSRHLTRTDLLARENLRPILIRAGSLGAGLPRRDLRVSPQHRILANSQIVTRMFGVPDVLITAKKLTALHGIEVDNTCKPVTYYHLVMQHHEVICAEGVPTESFYLGADALRIIPPAALSELHELFPDLIRPGYSPSPARLIPRGRKQLNLIARHAKNTRPIIRRAA